MLRGAYVLDAPAHLGRESRLLAFRRRDVRLFWACQLVYTLLSSLYAGLYWLLRFPHARVDAAFYACLAAGLAGVCFAVAGGLVSQAVAVHTGLPP